MITTAKYIDWMNKENMGSFLKIFAAIIAFVMVAQLQIWAATTMLALFVFFDIIDGPLARRRLYWSADDDTKRRRFDNISDVIIPSFLCLYFLYKTEMSLLWFAPLLLRELAIVILGMATIKHSKAIVFPNVIHKAAKFLLAIAGVMVLNKYHAELFLIIAYIAIYLTLLDYYGLFKALTPKDKVKSDNLRAIYPKKFAGLRYIITKGKIRSLPEKKNNYLK